jgi:hypothetical protein
MNIVDRSVAAAVVATTRTVIASTAAVTKRTPQIFYIIVDTTGTASAQVQTNQQPSVSQWLMISYCRTESSCAPGSCRRARDSTSSSSKIQQEEQDEERENPPRAAGEEWEEKRRKVSEGKRNGAKAGRDCGD